MAENLNTSSKIKKETNEIDDLLEKINYSPSSEDKKKSIFVDFGPINSLAVKYKHNEIKKSFEYKNKSVSKKYLG